MACILAYSAVDESDDLEEAAWHTRRRIMRNELYKTVWAKLSSHIAQYRGLSDVVVAEICRKLAVPRPLHYHR